MKKYDICLAIGLLVVIFSVCKAHAQKGFTTNHQVQVKDSRPNILVILADDLGYADVGFTGCKDIKTPHLDQLANNGIIFSNAYVTHPYCGPSRAGLLTGRYQARFGMEVNPSYSPYDLGMGLPLTEKTFASRLQAAGYRTGIIGKWHMGAAPPFHPNNRGFDYFYGFLSGGHDYFPQTVTTIHPLLTQDLSPHYSANEGCFLPLSLNDGTGEFKEYLTTALSRDAAEFVKSDDKPFMLYLAYNAPHEPMQAPKETIEKYKNISLKSRRTYAAMIDKMDEGIGMVIDALTQTGKLDNTIIFFLSDNGGVTDTSPWRPEVFASNLPYRAGKGSMYEGGNHVPFIVHWPDEIKKPRKIDGLVSALDIASTALAVAKVDTTDAKLDGVNLLPYLKGSKTNSPNDVLFWRADEGQTWAVRTPDRKFVLANAKKSDPELFDMISDVTESINILDSEPEQRKKMTKLWNEWNAKNQAITLLQADAYQKKRQQLYDQLNMELKEKALKRSSKIIE